MMAIGCSSPSNLRSTLESLSLDSSPDTTGGMEDARMEQQPTRSLLSRTLAGERLLTNAGSESVQCPSAEPETSSPYPEPSLLATSVGNDHDGRLIPSSSTISLLSLSNNGNGGAFSTPPEPHASSAKTPISGIANANPERVSSYTNLRSRNSITHLGQQRLQPYHKLSSPVVPPQGEFGGISSPKSIPWGKSQMVTPDSPSLNPTSFGESPSRFWLSAQTPPKSLAMPKAKNQFVGFQGFGMTPLNQANPQRQVFPHTLNLSKGIDSPVLNPVQTPSEDMPMTPLYLSSEGGYFVSSNGQKGSGEKRSDYFFGINEPLSEEKELSSCGSEDQSMT